MCRGPGTFPHLQPDKVLTTRSLSDLVVRPSCLRVCVLASGGSDSRHLSVCVLASGAQIGLVARVRSGLRGLKQALFERVRSGLVVKPPCPRICFTNFVKQNLGEPALHDFPLQIV